MSYYLSISKTLILRVKGNKNLNKFIIVLAFLAISNAAQATLITTSGSATNSDVSISFSQAFSIIENGNLEVMTFGVSELDAERDAVSFLSWLDIKLNGVAVFPNYQDFNDGCISCGIGAYIYFGGIALQVGDILEISGSANGGYYAFGSGAASNYTLLASGDYDLSIVSGGRVISQATTVSAPSIISIFTLGLFGLFIRKYSKKH